MPSERELGERHQCYWRSETRKLLAIKRICVLADAERALWTPWNNASMSSAVSDGPRQLDKGLDAAAASALAPALKAALHNIPVRSAAAKAG